MLEGVKASQIEWARETVPWDAEKLAGTVFRDIGYVHWSRRYEYPWAYHHGGFRFGQWVLDAAGGDSPFQVQLADLGLRVVNADIDPVNLEALRDPRVLQVKADLRDLPFTDASFDRVLCLSVLEHVEGPGAALGELWRVLRPGGRLLVTVDVASYARWNHTVDLDVAADLAAMFGAPLPPPPSDRLTARFDEIDPAARDRSFVDLWVLSLCCDKGIS